MIRRVLVPTAIAAISVVSFLPALDGQFLNWDDRILFTGNHDFRGLGPAQLRWMLTTTLAGHYMPLTWLTLGLNYRLGGMNPWGYHLTAILLHAVNAVLFYLVARRLLRAALQPSRGEFHPTDNDPPGLTAGAAVAALIFAVHPQRVESVAWVTDRGTLVSSALYLVATLAYLRAVVTGPLRWRWWGVTSVVAFAAGLLGKGLVISLPVSLLILDAYPLRRADGRWWTVVREKIPYLAVAAVGAIVILFARNRGAEWSPLASFGLDARLSLSAYSLWFYPMSTVWPVGLTPLHEVPIAPSLAQWRFQGPLLFLLAVTVGLMCFRRRLPGLLAGWVHAAVVVAPVSGIAHSGSQLVSDRYSYLAALGWALVAGYGVAWGARMHREGRLSAPVTAVGTAGVALLVGFLALGSWSQSGVWHDSESLWRWAVEEDPTCAMCEAILGEAIVYDSPSGRARLDEGEAHVRRAIGLRPTMPLPHYTLGSMELARGRYAEAEATLRTYVELAPALGQGPARLALVYLVQGRTADAIPLLRRARELDRLPEPAPRPALASEAGDDPQLAEAVRLMDGRWEDLEFLGEALVRQGQAARAVLPLEAARTLAPEASGPRVWLVQAYEASGQRARAREAHEALRRIDPVAARRLSVH